MTDPGTPPDVGDGSERMRALLARAAEEQLSEQRQVSAVLGELRALVVDLGQRLAGVEARLDGLGGRVDELGSAVAGVGGRLDDLGGRVDVVAEAVTAPPRCGEQGVRAAVTDSERRLAAHVDDAVLALAGVLLRRPRGPRADAPTSPTASDDRPGAAYEGKADGGAADGGAPPDDRPGAADEGRAVG